jgi:uncharacterized protein DUF4136
MRRIVLLIAGVALGGCSGVETSHDFDPSQDFSKLRTWSWAPPKSLWEEEVPRVSSLNHERIRKAIQDEMAARKIQMTDSKSADFTVKYHAAVHRRGDDLSSDGWTSGDLQSYEEGTLVVDVCSRDNRLIWRGAARTEIEFDMTPEEREARIRQVVHRIFEEFPPEK